MSRLGNRLVPVGPRPVSYVKDTGTPYDEEVCGRGPKDVTPLIVTLSLVTTFVSETSISKTRVEVECSRRCDPNKQLEKRRAKGEDTLPSLCFDTLNNYPKFSRTYI